MANYYSNFEAGVPGPQGPEGPQGPAGAQGATGSAGAQGIQGVPGVQGDPGYGVQAGGVYPTVAALLADTLADGEYGQVSTVDPGDPDNGRLYLYLGGWNYVGSVAGVPGATGETGATGAQGVQGPQGIQGIQGETGSTGAQGVQGIQGIQGVRGDELAISVKSADFTAAVNTHYDVDATSALVTATLPDPSVNPGHILVVSKSDATANYVRLAPSVGTINGRASVDIAFQYSTVAIRSISTGWRII